MSYLSMKLKAHDKYFFLFSFVMLWSTIGLRIHVQWALASKRRPVVSSANSELLVINPLFFSRVFLHACASIFFAIEFMFSI